MTCCVNQTLRLPHLARRSPFFILLFILLSLSSSLSLYLSLSFYLPFSIVRVGGGGGGGLFLV